MKKSFDEIYKKEFPCRHHPAECDGNCDKEKIQFFKSYLKEILNEIEFELVKQNTHYQRDDLRSDMWIIEEKDLNSYKLLSEEQLRNRAVGAVTAIQTIKEIINKLKEII